MKRSRNFNREAWLVVAQGGWWRVSEILEQMPVGCEANDPVNHLWSLEHRHNCLVSRGQGTDREYAVLPGCLTPSGVPVERFAKAITGQSMEQS